MILRFFITLLFTAAASLNTTAAAETEFRMITLQHRFADDILPVVQPLVGDNGSVRAIDNYLMITAMPERLAAIEQVIAKLDVERRNIRITISHGDVSQSQRQSAEVSGRARIGDAEIQSSANENDGIEFDIEHGQADASRSGSEFLTVLDGERAFIRVGQSIPYTQQWLTLAQRYVSLQQATQFHDITTGFAVRPRYLGDRIELEVTPRIARLDSAGFIDFEELSTVVQITPGEWFDLSGAMQSRDEVSRTILSSEQGRNTRNFSLKIKVD